MSTPFRVPVLEHFSWQPPVIRMDLATPPGSPVKGDRYVVATGGTGVWSGKDNNVAWYNGSAWQFDVPLKGWAIQNNIENKEYKYSGTVWVSDDSSNKADKVDAAVNGDLAALDVSGNLTDSGLSTASVSTAVSQAQAAYDERGVYDSDLGVIKFNLP